MKNGAEGSSDCLTYVCVECVTNAKLRNDITDAATIERCQFCGKSAPGVPLSYLTRHLRWKILERYSLFDAGIGDLSDGVGEPSQLPAAVPILTLIESVVGVSEAIARVIQEMMTIQDLDFGNLDVMDEWFWFGLGLEYEEPFAGYIDDPTQERMKTELSRVGVSVENIVDADKLLAVYFARSSRFVGPKASAEIPQYWEKFEEEVSLRSRFFSKTALSHLSALTRVMAKCTSPSRDRVFRYLDGRRRLYRARLFSTREEADRALQEPERALAPPPARLAKAGRMNAEGIAVFYGATSVEAAVAEVRPAVGTIVLVGEFRALRPLLILDVDALREASFDHDQLDPFWEETDRGIDVLRGLSDRISRPVLPSDEVREYVPTQVFAEFLSTYRPRTYRQNLDGILFKSVQNGGRGGNLVLFRRAARVLGQGYTGVDQDIEPSLWLDRKEVQEFSVTSAKYSWVATGAKPGAGGPIKPPYPDRAPPRRLTESELEYEARNIDDIPF
jgi:hypothetical protein